MIDIDKLLPRSIYTMTVDELLELAKDIHRFQRQVDERMKNMETPPALGVSVNDGIAAEDRFGNY